MRHSHQRVVLFEIANGRFLQAHDSEDPFTEEGLLWGVAPKSHDLLILPIVHR